MNAIINIINMNQKKNIFRQSSNNRNQQIIKKSIQKENKIGRIVKNK